MAEKGFTVESNLSESNTGSSDAIILNNLGGGNVSEDIRLFVNNFRNESTLLASDYEINGTQLTVVVEGAYAFSNRTLVVPSDGSAEFYRVVESNGIDEFKLRDAANNIVTLDSTVDLVRNDTVTKQNILNLRRERLETVNISGDDFVDVPDIGNTASVIRIYDEYPILSNYAIADEAVGTFKYKESQSLLNYRENILDFDLRVDGHIRITNDQNDPRDPTSPGLFIIANDGSTIRAFEDDSNPWSEVGASLQTIATEASINNLILSHPIITVTAITNETGLVENFTHTFLAAINGEEYHFLMST
jgi:hypothetical protein